MRCLPTTMAALLACWAFAGAAWPAARGADAAMTTPSTQALATVAPAPPTPAAAEYAPSTRPPSDTAAPAPAAADDARSARTAAHSAAPTRNTTVKEAAKPAAGLRSLSANGVPALIAPPAHGARLLVLWALDCAYCEPNLAALAALQRAHPGDFELVTVATDPVAERAAITARLRHAGVADYPAYAYAEAVPERLNFLIDPQWGGETPRVLLIRADGSRLGISGELTAAQLKKLR